MHYDWSSFKKRIIIKASVSQVYSMWTTSAGLEKWFLRIAEYTNDLGEIKKSNEVLSIGDDFCWRWYGWPDSTTEKGKVLEANGKDFLKFTFGQESAQDMICSVTIYTEQNETICELLQEHIPVNEKAMSDYHLGCMAGWLFYLTNMKSILEGGVDLRNKNEKIQEVINA